MLVAAICGAATDLMFSASGYLWQIINCLFTAGWDAARPRLCEPPRGAPPGSRRQANTVTGALPPLQLLAVHARRHGPRRRAHERRQEAGRVLHGAAGCGVRWAAGAVPGAARHPARPARRLSAQVFYNNLLSLPFILLIMACTGETHAVWAEPDLRNRTFLLVAAMSGVIGFAVRWGCACRAHAQVAAA